MNRRLSPARIMNSLSRWERAGVRAVKFYVLRLRGNEKDRRLSLRERLLFAERKATLALACCVLTLLIGCSKPSTVNTEYGRRRGSAVTSVNGTSVLARMFQNAGHRVVSRGKGAARIDDCDIVVWAPNRFTPPTEKERELIQDWLSEGSGRTFIYIGRDYDAAVESGQRAAELEGDAAGTIDPEDPEEIQRRLAEATSRHETVRVAMPQEENAEWFVARRDHPARRVTRLAGPWSDGIDEQETAIYLRGRFDAPTEDEQAEDDADVDEIMEDMDYQWDYGYSAGEVHHDVLLAAVGEGNAGADPFDESGGFQTGADAPLVTRVTHTYWNDSEIVVVTNGSFLLNLPLVNHQHRLIAGDLIEECGDKPVKVAFWDSSTFELRALADQADQWSVISTWPLNIILLHLGVLGIVYVLWRFPIFGPAKDLPATGVSDFAKHIEALGELMASTKQTAYARGKLQHYHQHIRRDGRNFSVGNEPQASDNPYTKPGGLSPGDPLKKST